MSAEVFIDTNVFIYQLDKTDARKHKLAERIVRDGLAAGNACISFQVVQECLNTVLRKAQVALDPESARSYLDTVLIPLLQVPASPALYHRALDVQGRWRFSFYDSLIVAAALTAGCSRLLSEDLQHGQRIETLTIHNPFEH
ncbi:MAG TPA: PIN domain-containing protein [Burkholderiaceae bacterium]|nr:PIN domain-containing protein [Burkholderiaceae bacterium]